MIDILLASYNGEKYIAEQIESILHQTYKDWFLYIKDDCSTDNTIKIILDYEKKYQGKIKVILSDKPSGSAKNNFFSMIEYSTNNYVMFCDQDDIWQPNKIEITHNKMKDTEDKHKDIPILVHTDLKVVDGGLNIICNSLFKMQNLDSTRDKLNNLLVQNIVTGCTMMINRNLLDYIKTIPQHAIMHDWWMALIASALGKIIYIEIPTVLYRQHNKNNVGAKNVNSLNYFVTMIKRNKTVKASLYNTYLQSGDLMKTLNNCKVKNEKNYYITEQYYLLHKYNKFKKIHVIIKYKYFKKGLLKVLGQMIYC